MTKIKASLYGDNVAVSGVLGMMFNNTFNSSSSSSPRLVRASLFTFQFEYVMTGFCICNRLIMGAVRAMALVHSSLSLLRAGTAPTMLLLFTWRIGSLYDHKLVRTLPLPPATVTLHFPLSLGGSHLRPSPSPPDNHGSLPSPLHFHSDVDSKFSRNLRSHLTCLQQFVTSSESSPQSPHTLCPFPLDDSLG